MAISDTDISYIITGVEQAVGVAVNKVKTEMIQTEVQMANRAYSAYSPRTGYVRQGRLKNPSNFKVVTLYRRGRWDIEGENIATGRTPVRLDYIVSDSAGHKWRNIPKRPWLEWTQTAMNTKVPTILRNSLASQGFNVK